MYICSAQKLLDQKKKKRSRRNNIVITLTMGRRIQELKRNWLRKDLSLNDATLNNNLNLKDLLSPTSIYSNYNNFII